jgi:hypothetical protein
MFCTATDHPFGQTPSDASKSTGDDICGIAVECVVQGVRSNDLEDVRRHIYSISVFLPEEYPVPPNLQPPFLYACQFVGNGKHPQFSI